ncbi:MAG: tRNA uridine-5-carboxymethylaminomethyl(34) synthesis GTPase MnmE [Deltaproteobacteria bacterium]|nr:tRNA uridine-5-carboxymethylaminomethyl(34) synthesis GTPase MnmE [Deltaproteobacteria bacterium]
MTDTIAAISTAVGEGGIGIIRISGPSALDCGMRVFVFSSSHEVDRENIKERYLYYGRVCRDDKTIDNGFFVYMAGPATYTGVDVVELYCHGGQLVLKNILSAVLSSGARPAMPGEFTKQAFLNGKMDLAQAEAIVDVIRAETELALSCARSRLDGVFSKRVNKIKDALTNALTLMEAQLDFPEEELPTPDMLPVFASAQREIKTLLDTYEEGTALKNGVRVIIAGRPNVGKSSLLNILLKEERAIVTPHPGTTRDVIEETINLRGLPVRLMDTAGLTFTDDPVEAIGVARARERMKEAHLILYVVDSASAFDEDIGIIKEQDGKKLLIVANKADLLSEANEKGRNDLQRAFKGHKLSFTSAMRSSGIEELKDAIFEAISGRLAHEAADTATSGLVVSLRHKLSLEKAFGAVERAKEAASGPLELCAVDTRIALTSLGEITGEVTTEDILDRIFSEFCIGK